MERGFYVLQSYPPGHQVVRSLDSTATTPGTPDFEAEVQKCVPCLEELEYMINTRTLSCEPCPIGARCATFEPLVPGSV